MKLRVFFKSQFQESKKHTIKKRAHVSGQIIATSHHATPNCGLVREITLCQGNLGW